MLPDFRVRFVHEALKKPQKLGGRICHRIHQVFADVYRGGDPPFSPSDVCVPIIASGVVCLTEYRWEEIERKALRGLGLLVVSADAKEFYAETESELGSPSISYSS